MSSTHWLGYQTTDVDSLLQFSLGDAYTSFKCMDDARKIAEQIPPGARIVLQPDKGAYMISALASEAALLIGFTIATAVKEVTDGDPTKCSKEFLARTHAVLGDATITKMQAALADGHHSACGIMPNLQQEITEDLREVLNYVGTPSVPKDFMHNLPMEACEQLLRDYAEKDMKQGAIGKCEHITVQNAYRIFALHLGLALLPFALKLISANETGGVRELLEAEVSDKHYEILEEQALFCIPDAHKDTSTAIGQYFILLASSLLYVGADLIPLMELNIASKSMLAAQLALVGKADSVFCTTLAKNVRALPNDMKEQFLGRLVLITDRLLSRPEIVKTAISRGILPKNTLTQLASTIKPCLGRDESPFGEDADATDEIDLCEFLTTWVATKTSGLIPGVMQPLGCPELFGLSEQNNDYNEWINVTATLVSRKGDPKTISAKVMKAAFAAAGASPVLQQHAAQMVAHIISRREAIARACSCNKQYKQFKEIAPPEVLLNVIAPSYVWRRDAAYTE